MPLSLKEFTELVRGLPANTPQDQVVTAALAAEKGTPLEQLWAQANRPLAGSADAIVPQFRHTHASNEGVIRRTAEDFGASLTSPVSLGTMALGAGAGMAGRAGKLGISTAARVGEAALQAPFAAEGVKNVVEGETPGEKIAGIAQAALAGAGMRSATKHAFEPAAVVGRYMKEGGFKPLPREPFSPAEAMKTGDQYEAMAHTPSDPDVTSAYDSLKKEIKAQYLFLRDRAGLKMRPFEGAELNVDNYPDSAAMQKDVRQNNQLHYYPTEVGFGQDTASAGQVHPMLERDPQTGLVFNDMFRAVHDYFGHAAEGSTFKQPGEHQAWQAHKDTLTPAAHGALATETKGQNSWLHSGPHLRDEQGNVRPNLTPDEKPYAQQKAGLLPEFQAGSDAATGRRPAIAASQSPQPSVASQLTLSPELLADVNARHATSGGSTTDLVNGRGLTAQDAQYVVSPYEARQVILDHPPTEQELRDYVQRNQDLLTKPGHNLGTWNNNGAHNLDVAIGENDLQKALQLGRDHKQLAIYDMVNGKDIPIEAAKPTATAGPTLAAVAGPAAAMFPGQYSDDPEQDARIRRYLAASGVALGAAGFFPKDLKVKLDAVKQATIRGFKDRGEIVRDAVVKTNVRKMLAQEVADPQERKFLEGLYHTIPLPKYNNINFDERRPIQDLLVKGRTNAMEFRKFTTNRLDTAYEVGNQQGAHWGNPEWIQKLVGGEPELASKFARTLGALSPGTPTGWNAAQGAEVFIRHVLGGEPLGSVLDTMNTFGVQNRRGKEMNLLRMSMGGRIYGEKTENLASAELGVKGRIPIDLWLLRAFGSHTDKTPRALLYRNFEDAFTRYAESKGEDPFTVMAKVWTGMQKIAGAETPSWQKAFEQMGLTGDLTNENYRQWAQENLPTLSKKLLSFDSQQKFGDRIAALPVPERTKTVANPVFGRDVQEHTLQSQLAGDVLGKKTATKIDRQRLLAAMEKAGVAPKSDIPF